MLKYKNEYAGTIAKRACLCAGCCLLMFAVCFSSPALAVKVSTHIAAEGTATEDKYAATMDMLHTLLESIDKKDETLRALQVEKRLSPNEETREALDARIKTLQAELTDQVETFNSMAAGEELESFRMETQQEFKIEEQLQTIIAPLLRELSDLTARPREIDSLRTEIEFKEDQLPTVESVIKRLDELLQETKNIQLKQRITELRTNWEERKATLQSDLQIATYKLQQKLSERQALSTSLGNMVESFVKTRGKNLALAVLTFFGVFFILRWLKVQLFKLPQLERLEKKSFGLKLVNMSFVFFVFASSSVASLLVLYASGDWLLLVIAFVIIFSVVWSAKEGMVQYFEEIKLVLNVGSVREGERVIYRGIPWKVERLNYYTLLTNPELSGGKIRVRLKEFINEISRPFAPDECWFPTRKNDWLILDDGTFGKVVQQSPDMVRLLLFGQSYKTYQTATFLGLNPKVISTGFIVRSDFGVDYKHQAIATSTIPAIFEKNIGEALEEKGLAKHVKSLAVDFSAAGASSLDIVIFITCDGAIADSYYTLGRIVQKVCVETCTREGWNIPFPQLTLHRAELEPTETARHERDTGPVPQSE